MDIIKPNEFGFTIYSKSGCPNCSKVKALLQKNKLKFTIVDCDEYIIEDKSFFLLFINELAKTSVTMFPIIFNNGLFIGGYNETKNFVDKLLSFEDLTF
jgi:glutaredoxin